MSDTLTPEHRVNLERLGIGTSLTPKRKPIARFQFERDEPLFAAPALVPEDLNLTPLYPYQGAALEQIMAAIAAGKTRIMLMLPTGGGKTVLAAHVLAHKSQRAKVSAFFVPLLSLVDQTAARFKQYGLPSVGVVQARHRLTNRNAALQVCSIQTLAARRKDGRQELDNLCICLVDEAHLKHDEIYRLMAEWSDVIFVGLSATPWSKGLGKHWNELIVCETIKGLTAHGKDNPKEGLCEFVTYAGIVPDLSNIKNNIEGNDYDVGAC